jgi:hypothetical protein
MKSWEELKDEIRKISSDKAIACAIFIESHPRFHK